MKIPYKKRNWVCLLTRDANILSKYLIQVGINTGPKFILKDWKTPKNALYIWKDGENRLYYLKEDQELYDKVLSETAIKDPTFPQRFIQTSIKICQTASARIKEISAQAQPELSNEGLLDLFEQFCKHFSKLAETIIMTMKEVQKEVLQWISTRTNEDSHQLLSKLTAPTDLSITSKEELSRIKIIETIKNRKKYAQPLRNEPQSIIQKLNSAEFHELKKLLKCHLESYAWIPVNFEKEPWDLKHLVETVKEAMDASLDFRKRQKEIVELPKISTREKKRIMAELKPSGKWSALIKMLSADAYVRFFRATYFSLAFYNAFPLLQEVAARIGLTLETVKNYTPPEIIGALKNNKKLSNAEAKNRKKAFAILNLDGNMTIYSGKAALKIMESELPEEKIEATDKVEGRCAYPGKVRGVARIVTVKKETHHIERGQVMVAKETNPDLVILMEKAAAIVTDEGGITSHAAIVSREMKKPCVIGTNIATKVFKDGDILEVDADKGVVKKVK